MNRLLCFLAGLGTLSLIACGEGDRVSDGPREAIVDGRVDVQGLYPHVVLVGQGCTGTLVTPVHVLTAAHCVCEPQETETGGWVKDASYCQNLVEISFESAPNNFEGKLNGLVNVHPMFRMEANARDTITSGVADLAVIRLNGCAPDLVQPVGLMESASRLPSNGVALGRIVGFGKTSCDAESRAVDRWWGDAFVTTVEPEFLEISSTVNLGEAQLQGAVSWSGDSGGPLLMDQDSGQWRVAGVLSKATCGQDSGDTAWYTNMHSYRDWFDTVVDPVLGAECGVELEPPLVTDHTTSFDPATNEVVVTAELQDRSGQGLANAQVRVAPLEQQTECSVALAQAPVAAMVAAPEGSTDIWSFESRITSELAAGSTLCVELTVTDMAEGSSAPSITRVTRCEDDCNGRGQCIWAQGICDCAEQWSGNACDVCTPSCDGLSCGDDGCGGVCGLCDMPPAESCVIESTAGETNDGAPIFGVGSSTSLTSYPSEGLCETGECRYEPTTTACPELLGYRGQTQADYGCREGRCMNRCEHIGQETFDFPDVRPGELMEPYGLDQAYASGVPVEVPFFCPEAMDCSGSFGRMTQNLRFACTNRINVSMSGQFWAECPGEDANYPTSLQVMLICLARGQNNGEPAVNQLPYVCPEEGINYSANTGFFDLLCEPPFPVQPCNGRIDIYLRAEFAGRQAPYITKILDVNSAGQCE